MKDEFTALVHDTCLFLQNQLRPIITAKREPPPLPSPRVVVKEEAPEPILPLPKSPATAPQPLKKGDWELQAMPPAETALPFRTTLAAYTQTHEPTLSVLLILPEENGPDRLFLENVSRAVTRTFAPASVVLYHDKLVQNPPCSFLLAPLSLFQKTFPQAKPHVPCKMGNMTWIPLESLDIYAHDVNSKRELWMTIQRMFQS